MRIGRFLSLFIPRVIANPLLWGLLTVSGSVALGQANADCLNCHNDRSLSTRKHGKTLPLYVDAGMFKKSAHADLECVACHAGLDPTNLPHAKEGQTGRLYLLPQ